MNTFTEMGLSAPLLRALPELGIKHPTPIQEQAIPILVNEQRDFMGLAQTGTGKTAAFGLPLLNTIDVKKNYTQALILAPTRELGQQIARQIEDLSKYLPKIGVVAVYGGAPIQSQIKALKKSPHIIIATPGRLIDMINRKAVKLENLTHLILDEADEMLNMGFQEDIDKILSFTPKEKNTWLFSATMPSAIQKIIKKYMDNPAEVRLGAGKEVNVNIEHQYVMVKSSEKLEALERFLHTDEEMRCIVFCRTKAGAQALSEDLQKNGHSAESLHGDLSQRQRDSVMQRFRDERVKILIATDVAARGIDVSDISYVIHYMLPDDVEYYTHRSGRTARAGKKGISLALITGRDKSRLKMLENKLKIKFKEVQLPAYGDINRKKVSQWINRLLSDVPGDVPADVLEEAKGLLADISKEELIARLLKNEFKSFSGGTAAKSRTGKERSPKEGEKENGRQGDSVTFFINIGKMDNVRKKELLDFICQHAHLDHKDVGDIHLKNKHTLFEVNSKKAKNVASSFKNMIVDGRKIRVNRDND